MQENEMKFVYEPPKLQEYTYFGAVVLGQGTSNTDAETCTILGVDRDTL